MILAIIGSRSIVNDTSPKSIKADRLIVDAIRMYEPDKVISGGAEGIDTRAVQLAKALGVETQEYPSKKHTWNGPGGFKERNMAIANACDVMLAIIDPHSSTRGSRWTAEYAQHLRRDVIIEEVE